MRLPGMELTAVSNNRYELKNCTGRHLLYVERWETEVSPLYGLPAGGTDYQAGGDIAWAGFAETAIWPVTDMVGFFLAEMELLD